MKNLSILTAIAVTALCASCGTTKKTTVSDYPQQWQQQQQQNVQQRPTRTMRTVDPCIELAIADPRRAYGTATSYVEKVALNEAARDARNQLAQMMKVAVEGAAQDYEQGVNKNLKGSAETIGEAVMTQFVAEEVKNTSIIKTSIYDLSDGSVQVYVCVEICSEGIGEMEKRLNNVLERDEIIGIQYDRDRFIDKMKEGLADYKQKNY